MIRALHERVDSFFRAAVAARPSAFACGEGCAGCCRVDLSVFGVEAAGIREAFGRLPGDVRAAAARRAVAGRHCAMLDDSDRCIVYEARPVICRTHGLAVVTEEGRVDACPLNFRDGPPLREQMLVLERVNGVLVAVNLAAGHDGARVRLASIAREGAPPATEDDRPAAPKARGRARPGTPPAAPGPRRGRGGPAA
jgi:hypothetical protein